MGEGLRTKTMPHEQPQRETQASQGTTPKTHGPQKYYPLHREKMLTAVKLNPSAHFILLLVEPLRMVEAVYRVVSSDKAQRLCGDVKPEITIGEVSGLWSYNPSTMNFVPQAERSFTALTDAVSVVL